MARMKSQFKLYHSVFIPFEYSSGEQPPFTDEVENVVQTADAILGERGYFTSSFENEGTEYYMFGFKRPAASGVQRKSERLFDLYFANVDDVEGKDLRAIVERLREFPGRARSPTEDVAEQVTVEVLEPPAAHETADRRRSETTHSRQSDATAERAGEDAGQRDDAGERRDDGEGRNDDEHEPGKEFRDSILGDDSRTEAGPRTPEEGPRTGDDSWLPSRSQSRDRISVPAVDGTTAEFDVGIIAELWERHRQYESKPDSKPIRATLRELTYFTATVEGSLPKFKIVEDGSGDVRHFNVVSGERSRRKRDGTLEQILAQRRPLSWDSLPSYRDELEIYRDHCERQLREEASYSSDLDELLDEFGDDLDEIVGQLVEDAIDLYSDQLDHGRSTDSDGGFGLGGVRGMLSSDENDAIRRIKDENTNQVSDDEKEAIAKEMMGSVRDDVWEEVEDAVRSTLMPKLEEEIDDHAEAMAKEVLSKVDTVKQSRSYDEA